MAPGARGGARVARVAAQFNVDGLPQFVGHGRLVAARPLHFGVEHEQVHYKKEKKKKKTFSKSPLIDKFNGNSHEIPLNSTTARAPSSGTLSNHAPRPAIWRSILKVRAKNSIARPSCGRFCSYLLTTLASYFKFEGERLLIVYIV